MLSEDVTVMTSSLLFLVVFVMLLLTEDLADVSGNVLSLITNGADLSSPRVCFPWLHRDFRFCAAVLFEVS